MTHRGNAASLAIPLAVVVFGPSVNSHRDEAPEVAILFIGGPARGSRERSLSAGPRQSVVQRSLKRNRVLQERKGGCAITWKEEVASERRSKKKSCENVRKEVSIGVLPRGCARRSCKRRF